ncbi:hypothetical protein AKO1_012030 [Acrasis kona]|uniref:PLD phosphodiesterase domain-containing protein n=1 Tax=Acrasis kona TaxID=1008807 RepID=A0AAW2ZAH9_9EUKA
MQQVGTTHNIPKDQITTVTDPPLYKHVVIERHEIPVQVVYSYDLLDHQTHHAASEVLSVTSLTASNLDPGLSAKIVFEQKVPFSNHFYGVPFAQQNLDVIATMGDFPYRPSDLFLKMYAAGLDAIRSQPSCGVVSPSLYGTSGTVPLTIVSVIPDIMQHYHDVIKNAKFEVLLATNAWEQGKSTEAISSAIRILNEKHASTNTRVVVKMIVDMGSVRNVLQPRYFKKPSKWVGMDLPEKSSIPHVDLEVINYHVAPLGTFHSKFMVVDRRVALVNSNNINTRSNVEMMTRFEGKIVNSLYDCFLISWHKSLLPDGLPCLNKVCTQPLWESIDPAEVMSLNSRLNSSNNADSTCDDDGTFVPFFSHTKHEPVPMAVVNRHPHATPGHGDLNTPQNAAWLAALRFAEKEVFIQSPTFNAKPIVEAVLDACKRGIVVTLFVNIGFNDVSEGFVPWQGGTNEQVVERMYQELTACGKDQFLKYYWYTAKDQNNPIHFLDGSRNCHVKFMQVDGKVGIAGSGNMDTQSWFHSQEVNVMVDSEQVVGEWMKAVYSNQNTLTRGLINSGGLLVSGDELPKKKIKVGTEKKSRRILVIILKT